MWDIPRRSLSQPKSRADGNYGIAEDRPPVTARVTATSLMEYTILLIRPATAGRGIGLDAAR